MYLGESIEDGSTFKFIYIAFEVGVLRFRENILMVSDQFLKGISSFVHEKLCIWFGQLSVIFRKKVFI